MKTLNTNTTITTVAETANTTLNKKGNKIMERIYFLEITNKTLDTETQAELKKLYDNEIDKIFNALDFMEKPETLLENIEAIRILFIRYLSENLLLNDNINKVERTKTLKLIDKNKKTIENQLEEIIEAYIENL